VAFEEALEGLGLYDLSGYGPDPDTFDRTLARHRWQVECFRLMRSVTPSDLDDPCGRFLTFRQLIECGEIQAGTGLANLPRQIESWNALQGLAEQVLDPVIDWFGMIRLTYGFCSPELAWEIPARIDPKLDQHAAHERNRRGQPICERWGAAVDFIVEDEDRLRWPAGWPPTRPSTGCISTGRTCRSTSATDRSTVGRLCAWSRPRTSGWFPVSRRWKPSWNRNDAV
jgi:hypothetical protein